MSKSDLPDAALPSLTPQRATTVDDLLARAAEVYGDRVAIVDGEHRYTYAQVRADAQAFARGLNALGLTPGDRVAIWLPNCVEWVVAFFGAAIAGAVVVPLNTGLVGAEVAYQIRQSGAAVVIAASSFRSRNLVEEALSAAGPDSTATIVAVGKSASPGATPWTEVANSDGPDPDYTSARNDPVVMLYTSGTTGSPKGAVHTHRFLGSLLSAADRMELSQDDCVVLYLPLFHVYALMAGLILMTSAGARLVLMAQFDGPKSLAMMEAEKASIVYGVPTTYIDQLRDLSIADYDLSTIRLSITPFARDLAERVRAHFGFCANSFGMTETASMAFLPSMQDPADIAMDTVGRPLDGMEARIVDTDLGTPVGNGEAGLLQLRGPQIMSHYHDKPDETNKAFAEDGWFRTGDVARLDRAGNLTFVGRSGDHFKVGGEFVDPVDVETALQSHHLVERAAVVGVPDARLGHVVHAWVKLRPSADGEVPDNIAHDLIAHARSLVAFFKVPRAVHVVSDLPVTPSGKVQKFKLTESLSKGES